MGVVRWLFHRRDWFTYSFTQFLYHSLLQVYVTDLEKHEQARRLLQRYAMQVLSICPSSPFADSVRSRQQSINSRWETLCRTLGVSYKKAEETVFNLQLLEAMLTQLNKWLYDIEQNAAGFLTDSCDLEENEHYLTSAKVSFE